MSLHKFAVSVLVFLFFITQVAKFYGYAVWSTDGVTSQNDGIFMKIHDLFCIVQ